MMYAVATLGFGAVTGGLLAQTPAQTQDAPVWRTDYEGAKATARQSGKPLFVVFRCER